MNRRSTVVLLVAAAFAGVALAPRTGRASCAYPYECFCPLSGGLMASVLGTATLAGDGFVEFTIDEVTGHPDESFNTFDLGPGDVIEVPDFHAKDFDRALIFVAKSGDGFRVDDASPVDEDDKVTCDDFSGNSVSRPAADVAGAALESLDDCIDQLGFEPLECNDVVYGCSVSGGGAGVGSLFVAFVVCGATRRRRRSR